METAQMTGRMKMLCPECKAEINDSELHKYLGRAAGSVRTEKKRLAGVANMAKAREERAKRLQERQAITYFPCSACDGSGKSLDWNRIETDIECSVCDGSGHAIDE